MQAHFYPIQILNFCNSREPHIDNVDVSVFLDCAQWGTTEKEIAEALLATFIFGSVHKNYFISFRDGIS